MVYEPVKHPALPCPECRMHRVGGGARIGNRRSQCATCNNFAQNVMRYTRKRLMELHSEEYEVIRREVEVELYKRVQRDFDPEAMIRKHES